MPSNEFFQENQKVQIRILKLLYNLEIQKRFRVSLVF